MHQLPPAICTAPVNETGAVVDVSGDVIAVGVSEAVGVVRWLDASAGEMGGSVSAGGTREGRCVEPAA